MKNLLMTLCLCLICAVSGCSHYGNPYQNHLYDSYSGKYVLADGRGSGRETYITLRANGTFIDSSFFVGNFEVTGDSIRMYTIVRGCKMDVIRGMIDTEKFLYEHGGVTYIYRK